MFQSESFRFYHSYYHSLTVIIFENISLKLSTFRIITLNNVVNKKYLCAFSPKAIDIISVKIIINISFHFDILHPNDKKTGGMLPPVLIT